MARTKTTVARHTVYLNEAQEEARKVLMTEAMTDSVSGFFGGLIADKYRAKSKPLGRPKGSTGTKALTSTDSEETEPEEEEPRDIPHPDDFGHPNELMTQSEYEGYCMLKGLDPATGLPR